MGSPPFPFSKRLPSFYASFFFFFFFFSAAAAAAAAGALRRTLAQNSFPTSLSSLLFFLTIHTSFSNISNNALLQNHINKYIPSYKVKHFSKKYKNKASEPTAAALLLHLRCN